MTERGNVMNVDTVKTTPTIDTQRTLQGLQALRFKRLRDYSERGIPRDWLYILSLRRRSSDR